MKRLLLTMFAVSVMAFSHAQEGEIIYTDFEPDLSIEALSATYDKDTIKIDLDQDGTIDFKMYIDRLYSGSARYVFVSSSWEFRICFNSIYSYGYMDENDTIVPYPRWSSANDAYELLWYPLDTHFMEFYMGFRKTVYDEHYYAWAKIYMNRNPDGQGYHPSHGYFDIVYAYCDAMAYCTIPDYPLRWGQTSLTESIDETGATVFATLHPNPTTSLVTITGENLRQAEVLNMLGQKVLSVQGEGDELRINMTALPAGVYFVNVTDSEGRKCVQKVVKE